MIIQPYSDSDQNGVQQLILEIQQKEFLIDIDIARQPDLQQIPSFYQKGKGNFWVAKNGETVIGTIALVDIGNDQGALRKMFVNKDYRGKEFGTGQKLLDRLLAWAGENGLKEILLGTTAKFLAAHRFYEKNGFEEIAKTDLPAAFPVMSVDVKFYRFKIG